MDQQRRKLIKHGAVLGAAATLSACSGASTSGEAAPAASGQTFNWKMTTTWPAGLPLYQSGPGSAEAFAARVDQMSGGRLKIKVYAAGELLPALEGFEAVSQGTVEMNHGVSYFWAGKIPAAQYFASVPFGMSFNGHQSWLQEGGGMELWREVYKPLGVIPFAVNTSGVQMAGWFKKPVQTVADLRGLKMRIPGLAGKVYSELGVDVKLLPGGEIFPALERGVIDAAEWVGPHLDMRLGLHNAAKYYYTTGWSEPATTAELAINEKAFNSLPDDLKAIVEAAAKATMAESIMFIEAQNQAALQELVEKHGVKAQPFPADVIKALQEVSSRTLEDIAAKDPAARKVHDSFMAFKARHDQWAKLSERHFLEIAL